MTYGRVSEIFGNKGICSFLFLPCSWCTSRGLKKLEDSGSQVSSSVAHDQTYLYRSAFCSLGIISLLISKESMVFAVVEEEVVCQHSRAVAPNWILIAWMSSSWNSTWVCWSQSRIPTMRSWILWPSSQLTIHLCSDLNFPDTSLTFSSCLSENSDDLWHYG